MQRNNNIILIYITSNYNSFGRKDRVFSFSEIKDPVNHLVSMMFSMNHPLVEASYLCGSWKDLFKGLSTEPIDIFDDKVKSDVSSFGLKFRYE